jgi:hypothetical protein
MKNLYSIYIVLLFALTSHLVSGQQIGSGPQIGNLKGINYQAVAIDENGKEIVGMDINGKPLHNKTIGVRFSILKGSDGPVLYQETHTALTDAYGLFSLVIGTGNVTSDGQYAILMDIPWIEANQFMKVEIATKNDDNYKLVSNQQFMSVPYSFYTDDIADNAITTAKILNETILAEDIATNAVTTTEILNSSILNEDIADSTIDLTSKVAGVLPVPNGGTGVASSTDGGLLLGGGTGPIQSLGQAADGQIPIGSTGTNPVLATLTAGVGIVIDNTAGAITISSGVQGVNSASAGTVPVGTIAAGETFISGAIPVTGVEFGNIVVGSFDQDMRGCLLSAYVVSPNNIKVAIFNGTGAAQTLGTGALSVLVVK